MRVLFLCHRVPYPPNRGDRIATHRRLLHLAKSNDVTCLTFEMEESDAASVAELQKLGIRIITDRFRDLPRKIAALPWLVTNESLTVRCFASRKLQNAARDAERSADVIIAYSSCMAQFIQSARAPRIMEFGDLDSEKWLQYSADATFPMSWIYARESRTLLEFERRAARGFDASLVVSPAEAVSFEERTGVRPAVVGNGVDLQKFSPGPDSARVDGLIVLTGIMNYLPNIDGCARFAGRVLPLIRKEYPNARFRIVGAHPSKEVLALRSASVEVTGAVADTADHLRQASVAVAPLRLGRGLQNKVLEAMACATPIVVSENASAGVDATPGEHFLLARSDEDFAAAVLQLLRDPALARSLGARARARMAERYPWERALADYDHAIAEGIARHAKKN